MSRPADSDDVRIGRGPGAPTTGTATGAATGAASPTEALRRRLGDVLLERGLLTPEQLTAALRGQDEAREDPARRRRRLGQVVVDLGLASERQVAEALADLLGLPVVDLSREPVQPEAARALPRQVAERGRVLVLGRTETGALRVASADPTNVFALDDVRLYTNAAELAVVVATETQIRDHISRVWSLSEEAASDVTSLVEDSEDLAPAEEAGAAGTDSAPTVRLVNMILADAVRQSASDIHIEPQRDLLRIRFRIDGLLRDVMTVPRAAAPALVSRVKIISGLDIAERRVPQDGRCRLTVEGASVDARVSTLPAMHGEKVVVRLLTRADSVPALPQLGLDERQLQTLLEGLVAPQGLILITGPTGSGKTNTLYAAISRIMTADRNIVTLEDPVEIQLPGITQVQVHDRAGLTFARGLRSILRQDPDVVLVGEVRDSETAELALQASLTGHLVLTTLHTNDAVSALTRLVDMGVEPFLVASSLALVVAQRLVRRPCQACVAPYAPPPRVLAALGLTEADLAGASPLRGKGCGDCGGTGYRGRTAVFEVLPVTAAIRQILLRSPSEAALAAAARSAGMATLRQSGIAKARRGETTFEEVVRACHSDPVGSRHCPSCARPLADDMVVCPFCDVPLDAGHCAGCRRPVEAQWRVCPWCRSPLARPAPGEGGAPGAASARHRLLVVDPSRRLRPLALEGLAAEFDVDVVDTGDGALRALADATYDGLVADADLPDLSAAELLRLLRLEATTAALPVLLCSSAAGEGSGDEAGKAEERARAAGADDVLVAPFDSEAFAARARSLAARRGRQVADAPVPFETR